RLFVGGYGLRHGHIEHRARRLAQSVASELGIFYDADDTESLGVFGEIETEMLVDGILVTLEKAFDEGFIDDGDVFGGIAIDKREVASLHQAHAEILQVVRADAIPGRAGI